MRLIFLTFAMLLGAELAVAETLDSSAGPLTVTRMLGDLDQPWAIGFLPDGSYLVTQRDGILSYVQDGSEQIISGVPDVVAEGQGGLLDVMIPRDFDTSREVFLSYSKNLPGGLGTALAVGTLNQNARKLTDVRVLFEMSQGAKGGRHFGSRITEALDGTIYLTLGERGNGPAAQDRTLHNGSVVRINRDGSVPDNNPFVGENDVRPEIYSYGHRNPQGAALDADGRLWTVEHGAKGGDEVNLIEKGANYGWPIISYGTHYSGEKIGEGTARADMQQPAHYWDPSIAPSGLMIYSGKLWPEWRGDLFVGSLKFDYISRLSGDDLDEVEQLKGPETERVRDVVEAPDGSIWFISVGNGAIYRMAPM